VQRLFDTCTVIAAGLHKITVVREEPSGVLRATGEHVRRVRTLTIGLAIGLTVIATTAVAEPPRTNAAVVLHKKPGEKQPVVAAPAAEPGGS